MDSHSKWALSIIEFPAARGINLEPTMLNSEHQIPSRRVQTQKVKVIWEVELKSVTVRHCGQISLYTNGIIAS